MTTKTRSVLWDHIVSTYTYLVSNKNRAPYVQYSATVRHTMYTTLPLISGLQPATY